MSEKPTPPEIRPSTPRPSSKSSAPSGSTAPQSASAGTSSSATQSTSSSASKPASSAQAASSTASKPTNTSNTTIAAPKRPSSNTNETSPSGGGGGGNGLAAAAIVLALVSTGAAFFIWNEMVEVQRDLAGAPGVDKNELEQVKVTLGENLQNRTDKATAELKTIIVEAQRKLESDISTSAAAATNTSTALQAEVRQSVAQLKGNINAVTGSIKQQDAKTAKLIATNRGELQGEFHQAITETNNTVADTNGAVSELSGSFGALRQQVQDRLDSTITLVQDRLTASVANVDERIKTTEKAQADLQMAVKTSQQELAHAIGKNRTDWALNEVEHILSIANTQVLLERSPVKAITTLRTADQRLQNINEPKLADIRKAVNAEIAALEGISSLDLHNASQTINRLSGEAVKLRNIVTRATPAAEALATEAPASKEEESLSSTSLLAIKGFANAAWEGISGGVVIAEGGEVVAPLLPPEHAFFLQQNLQLKLETARLALLRQDDATFHGSIAAARDWTQRYYDAGDSTTEQFIKDLNSLDALKLDPTLPDISNSLRALREIKPSLS